MEHLQYAVPTLFGLEGLCADEMRRLGIPLIGVNMGTLGYLCELERSTVFDAIDKLFEGTKALPWEQFIPREGQFPVKGHCLNSDLHSVPTCQALIKKAAAQRLGKAYGLNTGRCIRSNSPL